MRHLVDVFGESVRILCRMPCLPVPDGCEVHLGDFLYYYSRQLDHFDVYEVIQLDPERNRFRVRIVDSDFRDISEMMDEWHAVSPSSWKASECYRLYRCCDAEQRKAVERDGFASHGSSGFGDSHSPERHRRLALTIYPTPVQVRAERVNKIKSWWGKFLDTMGVAGSM